METRGETSAFLSRVEQLGCELAVNGNRKLKMILPELSRPGSYRIASKPAFNPPSGFKRDSLQDIF
jgi:hypothetical protein